MTLEPLLITTEILKQFRSLHHVDFTDSILYIFLTSFSQSFCFGWPRSPKVGFLSAGTLHLTQPLMPLALTTVCRWKADVCSVFVFVLFCFLLVCVCKCSLKHAEISCCIFQVYKWWYFFRCRRDPVFMMQKLNLAPCPRWLNCGCGRETDCVKWEWHHGPPLLPSTTAVSSLQTELSCCGHQRPKASSVCCGGLRAVKVHFPEVPRVNTCHSSSLGDAETLRNISCWN